jgi:hypothetical protein
MSYLQCHSFDQNFLCQVKFMVTFPNLANFFPFVERQLVQNATCLMLILDNRNCIGNTMDCPLENSISFTEFGFSLKKI